MEVINVSALIRSLQSINAFIDGKDIISTGDDFVSMYEINQKLLKQVGVERKTSYYEKRLSEFPEIFAVEINEYIQRRNGSRQMRYFIGGLILKLIDNLRRHRKSGGKAVEDARPKLTKIKKLNINFISVLEKPGLEELIEKSNE
ncbi:MAG: hypothetical protein ACHQF2_05095 [Flavobacteriales bacterium]